jgi:glycosyltransferase involved in cell wall biosynthesis
VSLRVAHIGFFRDPLQREPEQLLRDWPSLPDVAECASSAGIRITVIQSCQTEQRLTRNGIDYHFLPFGHADDARATGSLAQALHALSPDVLHVHGLDFPQEVLALAAYRKGTPILLQDHASRPPRLWRRPRARRGFFAASGIAFCSFQQAAPFAAAKLFAPHTKLYAIPESTSRFQPVRGERSLRTVSLSGDPAILWVGHLNNNKDPLTVLSGISKAARFLPNLELHCCFGTAPLLKAVQRQIAGDPHLRGRVHLVGRVSHDRIEQMMQAADLFVSGSHREGSGYSVIEALACGLPPVVTDIPSFRSLTADGSVGSLWPRGDAQKLCESLLAAAGRPQAESRAAARSHFEKELSFAAVGRKLAHAYEDLLSRESA